MAKYPQEVTQRFHGTPEQMADALVGEPPATWQSIVIEDYDPDWADRFAAASSLLSEILGGLIISIEQNLGVPDYFPHHRYSDRPRMLMMGLYQRRAASLWKMPVILDLAQSRVACPKVRKLRMQGFPDVPFRVVFGLVPGGREGPVIAESKFHEGRSPCARA